MVDPITCLATGYKRLKHCLGGVKGLKGTHQALAGLEKPAGRGRANGWSFDDAIWDIHAASMFVE
ncbi:hypothetical protein [Methyloterricola oryzae]|uniref:hypothetical protein n=1 Tax=Methyloterricola oryzae TaxID=1495050 RepID=UPI0011AEE8C1|nr:hypothetical protein [Methyloterricola oryzae]